jgi:hypothetical protein
MIGSIDMNYVPGYNYPGNVDTSNRITSDQTTSDKSVNDVNAQNSNVQNVQNTGDNKVKEGSDKNKAKSSENTAKSSESKAKARQGNGKTLTDEQMREVQELKRIDQKVRAHEMAHLSAAQGISISGATYVYKRGPDGVNYAVGGEVKIDTSQESDPQKTIAKAQKIVAAALAPGDPSPQDRQVAATARQMEAQARMEAARQQVKGGGEKAKTSSSQQNAAVSNASNAQESQQTNAGIKTYQQNQAYAPGVNSNNPGVNAKSNNITVDITA